MAEYATPRHGCSNTLAGEARSPASTNTMALRSVPWPGRLAPASGTAAKLRLRVALSYTGSASVSGTMP